MIPWLIIEFKENKMMSAKRLLILSFLIAIFMISCVDLKSVADSSISRDDSNLDSNETSESDRRSSTKGNDIKVALAGYSEGDLAPKFSLRTAEQSIITSDQLLNQYDGLFILFYSDW